MKVIIKRPGAEPEYAEIENSLAKLREIVGGHIETVTFASNACIVCNEEGRIKGLEYNGTCFGLDFFGPIIFVGIKGDEFTDYPGKIDNIFGG
jgi:hypothetical protein